jgi:hypothetical protein
MRRSRGTREKTQLALEWTETMRWSDVPAAVQEQLRDLLRALVVGAAPRRGPAAEAADERA